MKTRGNYPTESGSLRENVRPGGWGGMVTHRHDVSPRRPRRIYLNFEQKNGRIRTSQYTLFISQVQRNIQKFTHGCIYYLEH